MVLSTAEQEILPEVTPTYCALKDDISNYALPAQANGEEVLQHNSKSKNSDVHESVVGEPEQSPFFNSKISDLYNELGLALEAQDRLDEAEYHFRKALKLDPQFAQAHFNLGNLWFEQDKVEDAISCYFRAVALKPDYLDAFYNLGIALHQVGRLQEAIVCYEQTLLLNPQCIDALVNQGVVLQLLHRYDESIACYQAALVEDVNHIKAKLNLETLLRKQTILKKNL